jgi:hypothetical protein
MVVELQRTETAVSLPHAKRALRSKSSGAGVGRSAHCSLQMLFTGNPHYPNSILDFHVKSVHTSHCNTRPRPRCSKTRYLVYSTFGQVPKMWTRYDLASRSLTRSTAEAASRTLRVILLNLILLPAELLQYLSPAFVVLTFIHHARRKGQ